MEPTPPEPFSPEEVIAARDQMWQDRLAQYDIKPRMPPGPRKFRPIMIGMDQDGQVRCFGMNDDKQRIPIPCGGTNGES